MLIAHQVTGYVILAGFVLQGISEAKLNKAADADHSRLYNAQQTILVITNIAYGTTALLSVLTPPQLLTGRSEKEQWNQAAQILIHHSPHGFCGNQYSGEESYPKFRI